MPLSYHRHPLRFEGTHLQVMNDSDVEDIHTRMISLFGQDPSVTLSVIATGGNIGTIHDGRLIAGEGYESGESVSLVTRLNVEYNRIHQTFDSDVTSLLDSDKITYPVFLDSDENIRSMTESDFHETFSYEVARRLRSTSTSSTDAAGLYFISTSNSISNATLVSNTPVFIDTIADAEAFSVGGLPEEQDQPLTVNNYYLHRVNANPTPSSSNFLRIDSDGHIREMNDLDMDNMLQRAIQWSSANSNDFRLRYSFSDTLDSAETRQRGSLIIDTILDSDNSYIRSGANEYEYEEYDPTDPQAPDYDYEYRQQVPGGDPIVHRTYSLKLYFE
jgi:hypothetical protein